MEILNDQPTSSSGKYIPNPWNKLDDTMVETILAKLPFFDDVFPCQFVCKRWKSIMHNSPTFSSASHACQNPLFIMFKSIGLAHTVWNGVVFDIEEGCWKHIQLPLPYIHPTLGKRVNPVTSSSELILFKTGSYYQYYFIVCNPLTGFSKSLPKLDLHGDFRGISMHTSLNKSVYKVFVICGFYPNLVLKVYSSEEGTWVDNEITISKDPKVQATLDLEWGQVYRVPTVITLGDEGQIILNCLNGRSTKLFRLDTRRKTFSLTDCRMYDSYDKLMELVECEGKLLVVLLRENDYPHRSDAIQIWELKHSTGGKVVLRCTTTLSYDNDTNELVDTLKCSSGNGGYIMICLNSFKSSFSKVVMYDIKKNTLVELPPCLDLLPPRSAYSFMPNFQAKV